jgi:hypothetical protein
MRAFDELTSMLERVRLLKPGDAVASCPVSSHGQGRGDRNPSLHLSNAGGKVLVSCQSGCSTIDVLTALGLDYMNLFDEPLEEVERDQLVDTWVYRKTDGSPMVVKERWHTPSGGKRFTVRMARERKLGLTPGMLKPLFGLPELAAGVKAGRTIYVVEGEKCVAAARKLGMVATCSLFGAKDWDEHYWTWLKGADQVIVVVDNDEPGWAYGTKVCQNLRGKGIPCQTMKVAPPGPKSDLWDHVQAGFGIADLSPVNLNPLAPPGVSSAELLMMIFEPVRWVVDDVLPRGAFSILAGAPKSGKSYIVLDLALGVAEGIPALHQMDCNRGAVLYLSLDNDSLSSLARRSKRILGFTQPTGHMYVHTEWNVQEEAVLWCREWVEDHRNRGEDPALIVIDTMLRVEPMMEGERGENAYAASYRSMSRWSNLATDTGVAVLGVHHTRKGGGDGDWADRMLGSRGISAAAHNLLLLETERGSDDGSLYIAGRDMKGDKLQLRRDGALWRTLDQPGRRR